MLTTRQTAALLGLSMATVRELADAGKLPRMVLGPRSYRHRRADVEAYMARVSTGSLAELPLTPKARRELGLDR